MIARTAFCRHTQCLGRVRPSIRNAQQRGMADVASGSFKYETGEANGVKYASRDFAGPTTTLAVVAKAGTRYQILPGFTEGLEKFAFKATNKRSALRITRETELLGGELSAYHSRENLVIGAKFLRDDLPYFTEVLAEVISNTKYMRHEFDEEVLPSVKLSQKDLLASPSALALNSAHGVAFHRGLGTPLHPTSSAPLSKYLSAPRLQAFSQTAYAKPNFAVVANGASHKDLGNWVKQFFVNSPSVAPKSLPSTENSASKYYGGEERIAHDGGNTMVLAFNGSPAFTAGSAYKPEFQVLASLLGGQSSIKWTPGFSLLAQAEASTPGVHVSTTNATYSDAGLLYVSISGSSQGVAIAAANAVTAIRKIASGEVPAEDVKKAIANAKFKALEEGQNIVAGLELTGSGMVNEGKAHQIDEVGKGIDGVKTEAVQKAAKSLLESKATVSTVGDLYVLPFAEEIGLTV